MIKNIVLKIFIYLLLVVTIGFFIYAFMYYQEINLNNFKVAEKTLYVSTVTRDAEIKCGESSSYKIVSPTANDAMFKTTVSVTPNTPYKVSCMVKTEDVILVEDSTWGGAQIAIDGTTEHSATLLGTNDWTELVMYFNSKTRTSVEIAFRLGGYESTCTGTAWFDNLKLEVGMNDESKEWNTLFLIYKNTSVNIEGTQYDISMTSNDVRLLKENIERYKYDMPEFTNGKMTVSYDIFEIDTPITSLSYSEENGYFVKPENISSDLDKYIDLEEYDFIFIGVKLGDLATNVEIEVHDWLGLGGAEYRNIGFSNIRVPNSQKSYLYRYVVGVNEFPEEVFVHEFLHTLERNDKELGNTIPALHDSEKYGYTNDDVNGLRKWYIDYLNQNITDENGANCGLHKEVYSFKPVHESDFTYSREIQFVNEPKNFIEQIRAYFSKIGDTIEYILK